MRAATRLKRINSLFRKKKKNKKNGTRGESINSDKKQITL